MAVPLIQQFRVGSYLVKQKLAGNKRYPLVLMLEPLFRCNLACPGCGKIDYPDAILNKRLSVEECMEAVDECGAPMVSIPGGEPLLHKEIKQIVDGIISRKKFVYLCTNALLMEKRLNEFTPSPYFTWSVHLDGLEEHHDRAVDQAGTFKRAVAAIKKARDMGFRVNINCTLFDGVDAAEVAEFFDFVTDELKVSGITVSPGYAYERAPDQEHFLNRQKTRELFRGIFRRDQKRRWTFSQSGLFLDFLAGNRTYKCTPWSNPTRNVFGWQKPCYLIGEGYADSFRDLMETTDWDLYGTGNYQKCADCMVHCGYEGTAVEDTFTKPWKALMVKLGGIKTDGAFAPDIPLDGARPAEQVHERQVYDQLGDLSNLSKRDRNWVERNPLPPEEMAERIAVAANTDRADADERVSA